MNDGTHNLWSLAKWQNSLVVNKHVLGNQLKQQKMCVKFIPTCRHLSQTLLGLTRNNCIKFYINVV